MRATDWSRTALGPVGTWPSGLRTAVALCVGWSTPACLAWGPQRLLLCNDGCAPLLGAGAARFPCAFADSALAAIAPLAEAFDRAWRGEAVHLPDQPLALAGVEHVYAAACNPVRDHTGAVAGVFLALTDVTGPVQQVRASEQRFSRFMEHLPGMAWLKEPGGRLVYVNEAAVKASGVARERLLGRTFAAGFGPAAEDACGTSDAAAARTPEGIQVLETCRHAAGDLRHLLVSKFPVPDAANGDTLIGGIAVDVTERRHAEQALRRERELLQTIFDRIPVMLTLYDPELRLLRVNRAFERIVGWSSDEAARLPMMEACYPDPAYCAEVQAFMDSCRDGWMDLRMRTRDGRDIETSWANIRLSDRTQIGIGIDITERRRAEAQLRESERLYRAIGESIDYGVWVCDRAGRNLYASDSLLRLTGMSQRECSAYGWARALHPDDSERTLAAWKECVRRGGQWDREHRYRGVDGQWHPILARGVPVRDERGEITAWAGINLDISRLKQVEQELRDADRRKDEFLATLAHELRNPLAPLRNGLEIMRRARDDREAQASVRAMMERQLTHLMRLVDDLLDLSRISRGRIELRRERVDLAVVVRHALETCRPVIEQAGHELSVCLPPEPVPVEADTVRLAQAIGNLLNNAARYTGRGGHIRLRLAPRAGQVEVSVQDDGIGIPPAQLPHVFEMFARVDRPLARAHGGLGIGLSIVKYLVELHGGTIEARSPGEGRGSEFVIRLPYATPRALPGRAAEPAADEAADCPRRRVLVADDNADAAASLATVLAMLGNEVRTARDGREAVEIAAAFRPELVLLDIGMPGMDGCEACRCIRALPEGGGLVIAALTGWGRDDDRRRSRAAGFDHHLVKPVDPATLERLLATVGR